MPFEDLVEVYIALDPIEATVVAGILESAGLEPRIRDMTITPYPVSVGPLGEKRIVVPSAHAAQAVRVLRQAVDDGILTGGERIRDRSERS